MKRYKDYILLTSLSDPVEAFNVRNLLESGGIKVLETSNVSGPYLREIDGPLSQNDIYVEREKLAAARELLDSVRADFPVRKKNISVPARLFPLFLAALFFILYLFSNNKDMGARYILLGISILFIIVFLFSFRRAYSGLPLP